MINLMPIAGQKELAAARTNSLLLRYVILVSIFIGVLIIEVLIVYALLNNDRSNNEATITENQQKTIAYAPTKQQADEFRSNLATAKYILAKQTPYTTLILAIANKLPTGAVLDKLTLDPSTFGTPTSISVKTISYAKAIEIKSALQTTLVNDVPLFSSVSFDSVSSGDASADAYPYTAMFNVVYSKGVLQQ